MASGLRYDQILQDNDKIYKKATSHEVSSDVDKTVVKSILSVSKIILVPIMKK